MEDDYIHLLQQIWQTRKAEKEKPAIFFTVLCREKGYPVRFINANTLKVETFIGPFDAPDKAAGEFEACVGRDKSYYVDEERFPAKVQALLRRGHKREQREQAERERLQAWQQHARKRNTR